VLAGARTIVALDPLEAKRVAAREFGATHAFDPNRPDLAEAIGQLTGGRGADYGIVAVGSARAIEQTWGLIRRGGTVVVVGIARTGETFSLPAGPNGEKRLLGSGMGSTRLSVDVPRLVDLYRQGRLKLDELVTARYPLERINEAIEAVERGEALRNVIVFE
jgi:Zn-dependent alcohol dehydrogenase